jgi:hypothetical protein
LIREPSQVSRTFPRRLRWAKPSSVHAILTAVLALAVGGAGAGCQADLGTAGCQIKQQTTLPASPLTLLKDVRLDVIGGNYALIGHDPAANAVRWATLDGTTWTMGTEHAYGLPTGVQNPLFAMAAAPVATGQTPVPGDTVLIGYIGTDTTGTKGELAMIAVPADGSAPAGPAAVIHEFPGGVPAPSSVAMVSSRKGVHAGLTWIDTQMGQVEYAAIDGTGAMVVAPTPVSPAMAGFQFLAFAPGKDDVTVVYYSDAVNTANLTGAGWIIGEGNESGGIDSYIALVFAKQPTTPAVVAPTAAGYSLAFQNNEGAWLGVYTAADRTVSSPYEFAPSSGFGADPQPPLVALTPFGPDYGVLFQAARDGELWRVDGTGNRRSGSLVFPSALGDLGTVSAVEVPAPGVGLVATYADYSVADHSAGDRLFVNATCY